MRVEETEGVFFCEDDQGNGPFILRQSGTNNFVTKLSGSYYSRFGTPGASVEFGSGWDNPSNLTYATLGEAIHAASQVYEIEDFHISVEVKPE